MAISPRKRIRVIEARGRGKTFRAISIEEGISEITAKRWARRWREEKHLNRKPIPGRPQSTTPLQDRQLRELAASDGTMTARNLLTRLRLPIAKSQVNNKLRQWGFRMKMPRPYVSGIDNPAVRLERKEYAEEQLRVLHEGVARIYCDESTIYANKKYRTLVRVGPGHKGRVRYAANRSRSVKVSVFAGMCEDELLPLYIIFGNLDSAQFRDILAELYWPVLQQKFGDTPFRFILDNCPIHRAELVQDWLESVPEFSGKILFQPRYSPDLNLIEHVWFELKKIIAGRIYLTAPALSRAVMRAWQRLSRRKRLLRSLYASWARRLQECVRENGGPTKY